MAIKIPDALRLELAAMDLTIWIAHHPIRVTPDAPRGKADKSIVLVQLAGPGLEDYSPWGNGPTLRAAVNVALSNPAVVGRVPGLKGALMRCAAAVHDLKNEVMWERLRRTKDMHGEGELDDEVPF